MTAIKIDRLLKRYKDKTAVNGINLEIKSGELFGLLGVNGAGKTTTIRMLSCLCAPTSGDAWLEGHSIVGDKNAVKRIINVSPQETAIAPNLTVRENLTFISRLYGADKADSVEKSQAIIDEFHLTEYADKRTKVLSGGWKRRLSIAMAMVTEPHILFLDEPTLGLDVLARRELWREIEKMKGKITVVLTTHYLEEAEALCDRIGVMVNGDIRAVGTADELKKLTGKSSFEDAFVEIASGGELI